MVQQRGKSKSVGIDKSINLDRQPPNPNRPAGLVSTLDYSNLDHLTYHICRQNLKSGGKITKTYPTINKAFEPKLTIDDSGYSNSKEKD